MKKNISLTAALMLSAAPVFAQDAIILDDIVVSAGIQDIAINRTGASVDVIESEELAAAGTNMSIALDGVAGIATNTSGGFGATSGIRLRGLSQNYVAVRIDGIDYSDPTGTQNAFDFGGMTTLGFDRVEVLKGSQSAIYGSEAIGGVISFKTNSDADLGQTLKLGMEIGSYNTRTYDMKLSSVTETGSTSLAIVKTATDGFSAKSDNDEADAHSKTEVRFASEVQLSDNLSVGLSALTLKSQNEYDEFQANTDSAVLNRNGIGLNVEYSGDLISHQLSVSRSETSREYENSANHQGSNQSIRYTANFGVGVADISVGAEKTREDTILDGRLIVDNEVSYFAEALAAISDNLDVSAAVRSSNSDEFGSATVYRLATSYRLSDSTNLRAMMSTGYRAPSLYERYSAYGNPDFTPEQSNTLEMSVDHEFARGRINATYFNTSIKDQISFDPYAGGIASYQDWITGDIIEYRVGSYVQNSITTKSQGVELNGSFRLSDFAELTANYTYTDTSSGGRLATRVPQHKLTLGVNASVTERLTLSANATVNNSIADEEWALDTNDAYSTWAPTNVDIDDYTVVNLSAAYDLSDDAQAYVRIENAFDEDYETVKGFNTGGRMIFVGVRASF